MAYLKNKLNSQAQTSENFVRVAGKTKINELVREGNPYEGYKVELIKNKDDEDLQELFIHSYSRERRMRKLAELKAAKEQIMKQE